MRLARFKCCNCLQGVVLCMKLIAAIAKPYHHAINSRLMSQSSAVNLVNQSQSFELFGL